MTRPNTIYYNLWIEYYLKQGNSSAAYQELKKMLAEDLKPDECTLIFFSKQYKTKKTDDILAEFKKIPHQELSQSNIHPTVEKFLNFKGDARAKYNTLKEMLLKNTNEILLRRFITNYKFNAGDAFIANLQANEVNLNEEAFKFFIDRLSDTEDLNGTYVLIMEMGRLGMKGPNDNIYLAMINYYIKGENQERVYDLILELKNQQIKCNESVYCFILSFFDKKSNLEGMYQIYQAMKQNGTQMSQASYTILKKAFSVHAALLTELEEFHLSAKKTQKK